MSYVVTLGCVDVKDKSCLLECPVDCIYEGERMLYIHPDECIDCGACEPACPNDAIAYEGELPDAMTPFLAAASEFFDAMPDKPVSARTAGVAADARFIQLLPLRQVGQSS